MAVAARELVGGGGSVRASERMRTRESEGERQGGAWRLRGVEEEA